MSFFFTLHIFSWDLKSGIVSILNDQKEVGLKMVWISNGIWNPEVQPFEIRHHFVRNQLKSRQKCLDFEWSGFQIVGTIVIAIAKVDHLKTGQFENQPSKSPDSKCFWISNGRFQMPTVFVKGAE